MPTDKNDGLDGPIWLACNQMLKRRQTCISGDIKPVILHRMQEMVQKILQNLANSTGVGGQSAWVMVENQAIIPRQPAGHICQMMNKFWSEVWDSDLHLSKNTKTFGFVRTMQGNPVLVEQSAQCQDLDEIYKI